MSFKRGVKKVVASIAMEAVLEGVRGYLEELLRTVTPEQLYEAIQQDTDPWESAPSRVKRRGSTWARQLHKYQDRITPQLVLEWIQADRPDLGSLIVNMGPKGKKWVARRTQSIKNRLWPQERGLKLVHREPEGEQDPHEDPEEPPEEPEETPTKIKYI